jgi:ketosteroid isomerase-like protein
MDTTIDDRARRAELERQIQTSGDVAAAHEIYHDDAVLEFPQSGERFEGVENFREWRAQYPADVEFRIRRISGSGDVWVRELSVRYDGGPWMLGVAVLEFRGDRIARERIYVTEPWDAPEWRARWRAPTTAV